MDCANPLSGLCQQLDKQVFIIVPDQNNKLPDSLNVTIQVKAPPFDSCAMGRSFDFDIYFENHTKTIVFLPSEIYVYDDSGIADISDRNTLTKQVLKPWEKAGVKIMVRNSQRNFLNKSGRLHFLTSLGELEVFMHLKINYPLIACAGKN